MLANWPWHSIPWQVKSSPNSFILYAPELENRCRPHLKATNDSWRVDETSFKVKRCGYISIVPRILK